VLGTTIPLNAGTQYTLTFGGMTTPTAFQRNSGTIQLDFINNQNLRRVYNMLNNYPALNAALATTVTTATCTSFGTSLPGENGNVECVISVPLGTNANVAAIQVDFANVGAAQFTEVYDYCNAYVAAGGATPTRGQLSCSRQDPTNAAARFFITGFNFAANSRISFTFRARAMQSQTIRARASYLGENNGAFFMMSRQNNLDFSVANVLSAASNILCFHFALIFFSRKRTSNL